MKLPEKYTAQSLCVYVVSLASSILLQFVRKLFDFLKRISVLYKKLFILDKVLWATEKSTYSSQLGETMSIFVMLCGASSTLKVLIEYFYLNDLPIIDEALVFYIWTCLSIIFNSVCFLKLVYQHPLVYLFHHSIFIGYIFVCLF